MYYWRIVFLFSQNGDDPASDSNGGGHMTLPVECQEKHGYVLVDLQHIVRSTYDTLSYA